MATDLAVIEAALEAATPGPWEWSNSDHTAARRELDGPYTNVLGTSALRWPTHEDANLIANAPAWLAELVERVKAAEDEVERLRQALEDFAKFGTRCDTTPTIVGDPDVLWWYSYIQSMDSLVSERAKRVLEGGSDGGE